LRFLPPLLGLTTTLSVAQAAHPLQEPPAGQTTIRTSVNLVQVDAIVTDAKDRQVTDLKAGDFEILQDGKRQVISHFAYISTKLGGTRNLPAAVPKGTLVPPPPPVAVKPNQVRRTVALVVDDLGLSFTSIAQVRSALKRFVDERMEPGDLVAILRTGAGMGALQQFTADKRMLYAAIDRVRYNALGRVGVSAFAPIQPKTSILAAGDDRNPAPDATADFQAASAGLDSSGSDEERETHFSIGTLGAVRYVVDGLRELPGRKSVILFAENMRLFDSEGSNDRVMGSVRRLTHAANRSSVVINTIDPRGLQTLSLTAADDTRGRRSDELAQLTSQRSQQYWDSQEGLSVLAQQTGGRFVHGSNDIYGGVRKVMEDSEGYYLIGYDPDASTFDAKTGKPLFHNVKVKVNIGGLQVRSRNGFFGNADPEAPRVPQGRDAQLARALASPFGSGAIPLRLTSLFSHEPKTGSLVTSLLHIDGKALTFVEEPNNFHKAVFDVMVMTFGDNGQEENSSSTTYTMRLRAEAYHQARESGLLYTVDHPVKKAGAYQLRVALRDATSEKVGSASQFVEVPDVSKDRLLLSGIVLRADPPPTAAPPANGAAPVPVEGAQTQEIDPKGTPALRIFKPGETLIYGYQVLNARGGPGQPPQLEVHTRLFRDGQAIYSGQPQIMEVGDQPDPKHLMAAGRMQLNARIDTDDYVLQVVVTDKLARRVATQSIDFSVE
jgi:VWFA-related protein